MRSHHYPGNQTYSARQLSINVLGSTHKSRSSLLCYKFEDIATSRNNDPARKTVTMIRHEKPDDSNPGYLSVYLCLYSLWARGAVSNPGGILSMVEHTILSPLLLYQLSSAHMPFVLGVVGGKKIRRTYHSN